MVQAQMATHYWQLARAQRYQIEVGLVCGMTQVRIAKQLGVHPATVSREVRRNGTQQVYKAVLADQRRSLAQRTQVLQAESMAARASSALARARL